MLILLLVSFAVFFLGRKNEFSSVFYALVALNVGLFYLLPLSMVWGGSYLEYAGRTIYFSESDLFRGVFSLLVFLVGFVVASLPWRSLVAPFAAKQSLRSREGNAMLESDPSLDGKGGRLGGWFWGAFLFVMLYYVVGLSDAGRAVSGYDVRKGLVEGSWAVFAFSIVVGVMRTLVLLTAVSSGKKALAGLLVLVVFCYMLTGATGRAPLLSFFAVAVLCFSRIRSSSLVFASSLFLCFLLPVVVEMKSIIYLVSVERRIPDLFDIYFSGSESSRLFSNISHPLVSIIAVDGLLDLVGFRFFYDYIQGFVFYLRVFGFSVGDSLLYFNSENIVGVRASIVPTGYLAFGYVQLGYLGVFISGIFFRMVGYFSQFVYSRCGFRGEAAKFYFCYAAANTFYHGEVRVMIITFLLPMIVFLVFGRRLIHAKNT